ncbi:hypothetical protein BLS_005720 [Venturia inaequalis]|uniref:Uncharacterized protein n=1 Tax=Venturia inaequalis TaxID=5025 RepID=A0A8H3VB90_VENIN|nr:hypothetical protein EG328_000239 [Venturia inaequalis]KAE9985754.1 hypothetical protein BLS_005720 [Venturia inaequalis]KAE9994605.1 hypothetical protein EG327_006748 [Venturia inaequalis]
MKPTFQFFTTLFLAIGVSADWGPSILLAPACGNANEALAKAARGDSCQDDSVPLTIGKDEVHCLCGGKKIRDAILKDILPKKCKEQKERETWVEWFNGHCKDTRGFKQIVITNTNTQTFGS